MICLAGVNFQDILKRNENSHSNIPSHSRNNPICRLHSPKPAIKTYTRTMYGTLKAFSSHHNISASIKRSPVLRTLTRSPQKITQNDLQASSGRMAAGQTILKKKEISRLTNPPILTIDCTVVKVLPIRVSNRDS